jgi:von Willebrand factor type A domain
MRSRSRAAWLSLVVACGPHVAEHADAAWSSDGASNGDATECAAPDMLVVLDHTLSMSSRPDGVAPANTPAGHMTSKWYIAVTAINALVTHLDTTIRFGLELFPRNPNNGTCVTLSQELGGMPATNTHCQVGEIDVGPNIAMGSTIHSFLDPETTQLCVSTPIGAGLQTAQTELAQIVDPSRKQFVLLLTDGQDTCNAALPLATVHALATAGILTYVIGFGTAGGSDGIDVSQLNDLACAGHTAVDFATACQADAHGNYTAIHPATGTEFLLASDAASLDASLTQSAGQVCCGCLM